MSGAHITLDDVRRVARLARLHLDDDEVALMRTELDAILDAMRALDELDLEGVPETTHSVPMVARRRQDTIVPSLRRELVLRGAPEVVDDGFAVPSVPGSEP